MVAENFPIKVCGITQLKDAQLAVDLGAMALGFIFYPKSPRYISPEAAYEIISKISSSSVLKVGVFVNAGTDEAKSVALRSGIDILQLHGDETPEYCNGLSEFRLWKAFRLKSEDQISQISAFEPFVEAFLFDAAVDGDYGGTGHTLSAELLAKIPQRKPTLLAGGLGPDNWQSTYETYKPWAIDLSSSVESRPGIKDPEKLKKLFLKRKTS
ncbi:MAG: phosphoribosylanthranilate isomerase [Proteobacteria bacterium]|nr:MAG: phosphoribosylanthranilate isomerase [Pseudomonadota bacterium]